MKEMRLSRAIEVSSKSKTNDDEPDPTPYKQVKKKIAKSPERLDHATNATVPVKRPLAARVLNLYPKIISQSAQSGKEKAGPHTCPTCLR